MNLIEEIISMYSMKEEWIHIVKAKDHYRIELSKLLENGKCIETHHDNYRTYHSQEVTQKLRSLERNDYSGP